MNGEKRMPEAGLRARCLANGADASLADLIADLGDACATLARTIAQGALLGLQGDASAVNVQGETQKKLDVACNQHIVGSPALARHLAGIASEEEELPVMMHHADRASRYLLLVDPLDGSSNIDVNVSVGTIFSVVRVDGDDPVGADAFLVPGTHQVAAGYAIYGPSTMLVLTVGRGVDGFTFDRDSGEFVLTHPAMRIPEETREFAINASNERFWEAPVRRYVRECLAGADGVRGANFNMRWIASMVAEVHRILNRGGVFMYPRDTRDPRKPGRLRLMYEANPMSFLVEQAGGASITGMQRIMEVGPEHIHERIPVILGSRAEVERIARYHRENLEEAYTSPLFNTRTLFATPNGTH
jgi:fructose-1,6-bisphosphatase